MSLLDDVLAIPDHLARRPLAGRVGAAGRRRLRRPAGLRHGRLGDRRRPRRRGARRAPHAAAGHRARLSAAGLGRLGLDRALLQLLRRHRGDPLLLRRRRERWAPGGSSSAPAGPSSTGRERTGCRSSACRGSCSREPRSPTCSSAAAEAAALAGAAPRIAAEVEAAAGFLREESAALRERAAAIAAGLEGALPVIYGAELTAPVARRWKTQVNENAKLQAFFSELPEADHNEICGWGGLPDGADPAVVLLEDPESGSPRDQLRFELTEKAIAAAGTEVVRVPAEGDSRTARMLWAVMLGDLVSLELASARGVDPLAVETIDSLKSELARS